MILDGIVFSPSCGVRTGSEMKIKFEKFHRQIFAWKELQTFSILTLWEIFRRNLHVFFKIKILQSWSKRSAGLGRLLRLFLGLSGALTWCTLVIWGNLQENWVKSSAKACKLCQKNKGKGPRASLEQLESLKFFSIFKIVSPSKETADNEPVLRLDSFPYNFHLRKFPEESNLQLVALYVFTNDSRDEF